MRKLFSLCAFLGALLVTIAFAGPASAVQHDLTGRGFARLHAKAGMRIKLAGPELLALESSPCGDGIFVRVVARGADSGEVALPCDAAEAGPRRARHGRDMLRLAGGRLRLRLRSEPFRSFPKRPDFVEVRLTLGPDSVCARLERARKGRRAGRLKGGTLPCEVLHPRPNFLVVNLDDARADGDRECVRVPSSRLLPPALARDALLAGA